MTLLTKDMPTIKPLDYRPANRVMWDTWYLVHDRTAHAFYLQKPLPGASSPHPNACALGHATSTDVIHWQEQEPILSPNPLGTPMDDLLPFTGCTVEHDGRFYLYYTMRSSVDDGRIQRTGLAISDDLYHWHRYDGNPVIEPVAPYCSIDKPFVSGGLPIVDCRDIVVIPDPDRKGSWLGYYAARVHTKEMIDGAVVALVRSDDLIHWEHLPPAFVEPRFSVLEVPEVFQMPNGKWYMSCLTGQGYGNRCPYANAITEGTIWAVSDHPHGPFQVIDGQHELISGFADCGYSCRTLVFDDQRLMLYTQNVFNGMETLSPPMRVDLDGDRLFLGYSPLQDKCLGQQCWDSSNLPPINVTLPTQWHWCFTPGSWEMTDGQYRGQCQSAYQVGLTNQYLNNFQITANVRMSCKTAGIALRPQAQSDINNDPWVWGIDSDRRCFASKLPKFHPAVIRQYLGQTSDLFSIRLVVRQPRYEFYVNDELMLQGSLDLIQKMQLGFWVESGNVALSYVICTEL
jgi:beta-fructofuranosidase